MQKAIIETKLKLKKSGNTRLLKVTFSAFAQQCKKREFFFSFGSNTKLVSLLANVSHENTEDATCPSSQYPPHS